MAKRYQYKDYSKYGFRRGRVRKVLTHQADRPQVDPIWLASINPQQITDPLIPPEKLFADSRYIPELLDEWKAKQKILPKPLIRSSYHASN